ncbi:MAG: hypothetical protein JWN11_2578 [Hyphomicrobiales bacterium]|nr:hypothetical protein [Hyphomicrobiales bacterium]
MKRRDLLIVHRASPETPVMSQPIKPAIGTPAYV